MSPSSHVFVALSTFVLQLVLVIDSREQYSNVGRDRVDSLARHVQLVRDRSIAVDVRTLQQGDALWIAKPRSVTLHPIQELKHFHENLSKKPFQEIVQENRPSGCRGLACLTHDNIL